MLSNTRRLPLVSLALFVLVSACAAPLPTSDGTARPEPSRARPLPALEDALRIWDSAAGEELALAQLLARLAQADVVFVGETHLDDTTHRFQAALLEGLIAQRARAVVLSLEMFERDVQPVLDEYLAGRLDERAFLAAARPWGNYASDYRPLVECAKAHDIPVIAANTPAALRRKLSSGGRAALDALAPEERRLLPAEILPASGAYWERVDRATRGHMNFASLSEEKRLFAGQNLWDNSMGAACAEALAAHPGATVVHVVGGFHTLHGDGTAAQLRLRAPAARVALVQVVPAAGLFAARPERDAGRADYLVYAAELGRSLSDGTHAVAVPAELRYTLDVPAAASAAAPAPLVVWLPDADERPEDARALWRAAFGDEAALAVVEPPYPERGADLAPGGRYSHAASFRADQARVAHALERLVEQVTRRYPVEDERVVIAGRGLGATAALWCALHTDWLAVDFVALEPRGVGAFGMEGLPERAPATRAVRLLVAGGSEAEAEPIAADFRALGTPVELEGLAAEASLSAQAEDALRAALALAPRLPESGEPVVCVLERDLPRARQWAEIYGRRLAREGHAVQLLTLAELAATTMPAGMRVQELRIGGLWPVESFAAGRGLPLAPGDFGGTTVLVVPAAAEAAEREAWLALERDKALRKRSPFAGLRVALEGAEPRLAQVLTDLRAAGARSVLVVPAVFCASPEEMRALADAAGEFALGDALDLSWLPGLGGELCAAEPEE